MSKTTTVIKLSLFIGISTLLLTGCPARLAVKAYKKETSNSSSSQQTKQQQQAQMQAQQQKQYQQQ